MCADLTDRGFTVHMAANGAAAVDVAARRGPDVILMDPALSAMDRWHAVKRLNSDVGTSRIPVLTLASDASSPAGMQRVLSKIERTLGSLPQPARTGPPRRGDRTSVPPPVKSVPPAAAVVAPARADVDSTAPTPVARGRRTAATPAPAAVVVGAATPPLPPRRSSQVASKLLVVDDNALNRDMLSRRLRRRGYEVAVAEDGAQALEVVESDSIDLVLLDWMMPGLSGIDVLRKLRETYSQVQLPVIMATAKTEADDIVEALKAEANDYVTKPLNFDVVHARIRTQLNLVKAHRELEVSQRRFKALLENTGDMIVQYTPSGQVRYVSPASLILLGWEPDALKQRSFYDWIHPIDRRELLEQQRQRGTLPENFTFLSRMQRQDASYIWVETSCRVLSEDGDVLIQAACRDVTEHMQVLPGDEPPLPLGGDIMAHPGWRSGSHQPAPERQSGPSSAPPAAVAAAPAPTPVVLLATLDGHDVASLDRDALLKRLAKELAARLDE
jgi:PAS domain S-box-containing protein